MSFRRNFYLKRGEYQIKNGFLHFICHEILYNLIERFFEKKIFGAQKFEKSLFRNDGVFQENIS